MQSNRPLPASSETARAIRGLLMPCLMIRGGRVMLPGPTGPVVARDPDGKLYDVLDVSDQLGEKYGRLYVVDLDGLERDEPQLDYLQEIARASEVWVDAGVRTGDQAIDVVVAGAFRTVLSTAFLESERELRRAWKLSPEVAFEIELTRSPARPVSPDFAHQGPAALAQAARGLGLKDIILSPRGQAVDWSLVRELAAIGPVWVDGSFEYDDLGRLIESGAVGGIFHITDELEQPLASPAAGDRAARNVAGVRDDES